MKYKEYKEWKEIQPLQFFRDGYAGVNGEMYKRLHISRCTKNYPSLWKKIRFRWLCWLKYFDDRRYYRLED